MWPVALLAGAVCGLGVFLVIWGLVPGAPRLRSALDRLAGKDQIRLDVDPDRTATARMGQWLARHAPEAAARFGPRDADLDLLGSTRISHYGQKALCALAGLLAVPILVFGTAVLGIRLPVVLPAASGVILAIAAWFLPDLDARGKARRARQTFTAVVSTYLELLAIERISGSGASQAMFCAAQVGESWPFQRIRTALERGRWDGRPPWHSLRVLADDVAVPELRDVADIMEQAGTEGSAVHDQLQSRAAAMRDAQLDIEQQLAHDATVRMTIPGTLTVLVYFVMLLFPIAVSLFATTREGA